METRLEDLIEHAAGALPVGYSIAITLEQGCADVELSLPYPETKRTYCLYGDNTIAECVMQAICDAREHYSEENV